MGQDDGRAGWVAQSPVYLARGTLSWGTRVGQCFQPNGPPPLLF